jgi:hypothetical protein
VSVYDTDPDTGLPREPAALQCPWIIHWAPGHETRCEKNDHLPDSAEHRGLAMPGKVTKIVWFAGDRREYTGPWPGICQRLGDGVKTMGCALPAGHRGQCAPGAS